MGFKCQPEIWFKISAPPANACQLSWNVYTDHTYTVSGKMRERTSQPSSDVWLVLSLVKAKK